MGTVWHGVDRLKPLYPLSAFHSVSVPFIMLVCGGGGGGSFLVDLLRLMSHPSQAWDFASSVGRKGWLSLKLGRR